MCCRLCEILSEFAPEDKILIFCQTKRGCDLLASELQQRRIFAAAIHGDKSQWERDRIISDFKRGYQPILVATDLAARGLDIKDIKCVINYDLPLHIEDYIHRVGRTGRAGAEGRAISFFTYGSERIAADLIAILRETKQEIPSFLLQYERKTQYTRKAICSHP